MKTFFDTWRKYITTKILHTDISNRSHPEFQARELEAFMSHTLAHLVEQVGDAALDQLHLNVLRGNAAQSRAQGLTHLQPGACVSAKRMHHTVTPTNAPPKGKPLPRPNTFLNRA